MELRSTGFNTVVTALTHFVTHATILPQLPLFSSLFEGILNAFIVLSAFNKREREYVKMQFFVFYFKVPRESSNVLEHSDFISKKGNSSMNVEHELKSISMAYSSDFCCEPLDALRVLISFTRN